ncbi:phage tail protein [Sphingomonas sp. TREG-RG-20F-R18-01]|uniref:phage tail protein n=1 Tax=Sphingomonas sp. TREG-RG-20F-R18-01 TaxID=2914982 RepID=UPI001F5AE83E|nr:phage tail protein [Sphingomonas sp. TREG-RG-20F-R18-01]
MSIHYGIAAELDAITGIIVGEKDAWTGEVNAELAIPVSAPELFGGQKKEGGVGGIAYFLPGGPDQVLPQGFAQRRGLTSATHPAYRGLASIYMVGTIAPGEGFYWGNTPYMNGVWVRGRRAPKGLTAAYAMIGNRVEFVASGYDITIGDDKQTVIDGQTKNVGGYGVSVTVNASQNTRVIGFGGEVLTVYYSAHVTNGAIVNDGTGGTVIDLNGTFFAGNSATLNGIAITAFEGDVTISLGESGQDANPAHIIYECLTNTTWGMGATDGIVDRDNFEAVGRTLYNEGFGMSLAWTRQSSIESFITEIIDHIQGAIYVDPQTGKITLKLFRDDYDESTLPLITPDNADLDSFQRKLWGETVNEIVVTWTNPANEQEETITQQDLGNITVQRAVVSDSRNYYGVRNAALASRLAQRDSRQSAAPLASVEAQLDRTQWNLRPGDIVRLTWPEYDIVNLIMRVTTVDYGKIGVPQITVSLLEDIFSLENAAYNAPPLSGWINPANNPTPMDHVRVITSPAYFSSRRLSAADAAMLEYPDVLVALLAASSNPDASLYEMVGQSVLPNGQTVAEELGTRTTLGYASLQAALVEEAQSVVTTFGPIVGGTVPTVSGFAFIGDASERFMEIALLDSFNENGWTMRRGTLDTIPRAWPAGTPVWFYDIRNNFFDPDIRSEGEAVNFKLLTITSKGRLPIASAPVVGAMLTARPHLPNRPANVTVAGVPFGAVDLSGLNPKPSVVPITWANRNRTMEDGTIVGWTDANVVPEAGQTTTIKVVSTAGTVLATHAGITGTSFDVPVTDWGSEIDADIMISSMRDSFESLQTIVRRVRIVAGGGSPGNPGNPTPEEPYDPGPSFPQPWRPPCLVAESRYLMANSMHDGPGGTCSAYELVPGGTWLWTQDAVTKVWGSHLVMVVELVEADVMRAEGLPRATPLHPFWIDGKWVRMEAIGASDGVATVARVTVEGAASYITVEADGTYVLSHNLKSPQYADQ